MCVISRYSDSPIQTFFVALKQYQEFISIAQVVANEARSEYLQRMSLTVPSV